MNQAPSTMFFPHQANLQQMDVSELKDLLVQVIQVQGIDINNPNSPQALMQMLQGQASGQYGNSNFKQGGYHRNQGFQKGNQFQNNSGFGMPQPVQANASSTSVEENKEGASGAGALGEG